MKIVAGFFSLLGLALLVVLAMSASRPDDFKVEESLVISQSPEVVFSHVAKFQDWEKWSPWKKKDPTVTNTFSGAENGVGSISEWKSEKSGSGKMVMTEFMPNQKIAYELTFYDWESTSTGTLELKSEGTGTRVLWTMSGKHKFTDKVFWTLFNFERAIKKDFKSGLKMLRKIAEGRSHSAT